MKRSPILARFLEHHEKKWGNETPGRRNTIKPYQSSLMSVDLSILARGIPIDPLPELYTMFTDV